MTGTLRATRVPYDRNSAEYDEAMVTLDEHAGCYPVSGELRVRAHENCRTSGSKLGPHARRRALTLSQTRGCVKRQNRCPCC